VPWGGAVDVLHTKVRVVSHFEKPQLRWAPRPRDLQIYGGTSAGVNQIFK